MKIFSLALIGLLTLSQSTFAYKIISEHWDCNGNIGGECMLMNEHTTSFIKSVIKEKTMIPYSVHAYTEVQDQNGFDGQRIKLKAHHEVRMRNGDDHKKTYHYFFEIECYGFRNKFDRDIELEAHEEFTTSADSNLDVTLGVGTYKIGAHTGINTAETDRMERGAYLRIR